jgi:predicted transcriptional regulator
MLEANMANITLKIDDTLLERARKIAVKKNTTLNSVVRKMIHDFIKSDTESQEALSGLKDFYQRCDAKIGNKTWTREDLHER